MPNQRPRPAFTLIELLVVIALVALAVLVWFISRSTRRARVTDEDGAPGLVRDIRRRAMQRHKNFRHDVPYTRPR